MADPEHLAKLQEGVEAWNEWRHQSPEIKPDLGEANLPEEDFSGANLNGVDLGGADLRVATLSGTHLRGANLEEADLSEADLSRADLDSANLREADLFDANLERARLTGASLRGANLFGAWLQDATLERSDMVESDLQRSYLNRADLSFAVLTGANLTGAFLGGLKITDALIGDTMFGDNDLSTVEGLETVRHDGPSTIGIDTIYQSKGKIPESFLRGCGVPDQFITYVKSLAAHPIEFYSCFISYSTKDQEFADRLYADLQNKGVRCWFASHDIKAGEKLHEQIDDAIRLHDKLLLILSPQSMGSEWVKTEIAKARKREVRDKRRVLFPIRLTPFETLRDWECFDADTGKDSACEIREYFIPDFSNWKNHDSYKEAFERLLKDLKTQA